MIYGIVKNQKLDLRAQAAADTIDYLTAKFSFISSDWEGLVKYAHFRQGTNIFSVQLIDDKIDEIDHLNLTKGEWEVYLHGNEYKDGNVKKRITTNIATFTVEPTGALNGEPFPEVEPSVVEQIEADVEDHEERITALEEAGGGDVVKDVIQDGASLVNEEKIAVLPKKAQSIELVDNEQTMVLKYNPTDIIEMWGNSLALTFKNNVIIRVESYGARGADFYYIAKSSNKIALLFARYTAKNSPQVYDVLSGIFSDVSFTAAEKTKLSGIESGAQVNPTNVSAFNNDAGYVTQIPVTDVQDHSGVSLVSQGVAILPEIVNEIYDETVSGIAYSKYTGAELYPLFLAGKLYCYDGHLIVGMSVVDSTSYFVYYFAGGAITIESDYNCSLRRITLDNNKVLSNDAYCGSFSKNDYTSSEKTKLSGIATGAQVNVIEKIKDSNGTELTITDKAVTLPAIPAAQIQSDWSQTDTDALDYIKNKPSIPSAQVQSDYAQSNSSAVDYIKNKPNLATVATSGSYNDLSDKPTIPTVPVTDVTVNGTSVVSSGTAAVVVPTAGTITSGNQGYAKGGDVYTAIGNIPQIPVGTNVGDILVWNGSAWVARQQGTLPAGYRQTQYIEFTGTEYVDTGVKLSDIVDVRCDISFTDLTEMGNNGANEGDNQNTFMMNYRPGTPNKISFGYKSYGGGNYWVVYDKLGPEIDSADTIYQVFVSLRDRAVYFGATKYTPNYTMTQSLLGSNTYYIGAANSAGVPQLPAKERVYILTFYNYRSERIADFVPCVREADNKAGLYDVVGEQFHAIQIIE